uniref:Uncharacterized protein n=1 Tax=Firmicutes phage HS16 TaxID=3056394 RepID=A0AA49X386_9VIRU|nr:MAG: hypothetical protein [Firmicutes phage HS16]
MLMQYKLFAIYKLSISSKINFSIKKIGQN